jgi:Domain of unknown function (DUF4249)
MKKLAGVCFLLSVMLCCCRKPYNPPAITAPASYLVVEGVINAGSDSTTIKLSKTVPLSSTSTYNPVIGATVAVESSQNNSWPLIGDGKGNYVSAGLNLSASLQYRLSIQTPDGKQYLSAFVPVQATPPIDSVGYNVQSNGLQLYVNTHDPSNTVHYYRWDYTETWQFHARYESFFVYDTAAKAIVPRTPAQNVYTCFGNDTSSSIFLFSTSRLSKDVVYEAPLTSVPFTSEKLEAEYSILVRQYALTSGAYQFYLNMQQNTQQLGSIFDAQPSQAISNIHNINNAEEPVAGYVTVTNIQSKRIFISSNVVPNNYNLATIYPYSCEQDTALLSSSYAYDSATHLLDYPNPAYLPTTPIYAAGGVLIGYMYSTGLCTNCTLRGTTQVPSFWP